MVAMQRQNILFFRGKLMSETCGFSRSVRSRSQASFCSIGLAPLCPAERLEDGRFLQLLICLCGTDFSTAEISTGFQDAFKFALP